jgi:hypothetical protein
MKNRDNSSSKSSDTSGSNLQILIYAGQVC